MRIAIAVAVLTLAAAAPPPEDSWPEFRGAGGTGHSAAKGLAREWSETKNVAWKIPIHDAGWSSPVVHGKQVWLTTAKKDGTQFFAICVDRESGKVILDAKIFDSPDPSKHWTDKKTWTYNTFASPTPAIEEDRVYVHFGAYGTACLSTDTGKVLWARQDLDCNHWRGPGSSPVIYKNLLFLTFDGFDVQYVVALDKKTGRTVWKRDRSHAYKVKGGDGDFKKAYTTPAVFEIGGRAQIIAPAAQAVHAYDALTGDELWHLRHEDHSIGARPQYGHGLVYVLSGISKSELLAIRPDGKGDVTDTHVAWRTNKSTCFKAAPVLIDDLMYFVSLNGGAVTCLDAKTGAEVWKGRVGGSAHTSSPWYADGALYFFAEDGSGAAIQPGREFKELGKGKLENGRIMATPAVAGKSIFFRGDTHLYKIESR